MDLRINRGPKPEIALTFRNYRKALPELRRDFQDRCAYSMQHISRAGGIQNMDVDFFDPRRGKKGVVDYNNLFLASHHCNIAKGDFWPSKQELASGIRLLNPCEEMDYGVHIFEDPITHNLVGVTPSGRIQIRVLALNAPHLVEERRQRSELWATFTKLKAEAEAKNLSIAKGLLEQLEEVLRYSIPPIPPPPALGEIEIR
jgi:hypothetical protein